MRGGVDPNGEGNKFCGLCPSLREELRGHDRRVLHAKGIQTSGNLGFKTLIDHNRQSFYH